MRHTQMNRDGQDELDKESGSRTRRNTDYTDTIRRFLHAREASETLGIFRPFFGRLDPNLLPYPPALQSQDSKCLRACVFALNAYDDPHWDRENGMFGIQKVKDAAGWIRHPDQTLLRIEARWVLKWFVRYPGILWLFVYVLADMLIFYQDEICSRVFGASFTTVYPVASLYFLNKVGFWAYFVQRRVGRFFSPEHLSELAVAPCESRVLWPALCLAPALGLFILISVDIAGFFALDAMTNGWICDPALGSRSFLQWVISFLGAVILVGIIAVSIFGLSWYVTVYAVSKSMPSLGSIRLIWHGFVGYLRFTLVVGLAPSLGLSVFPVLMPRLSPHVGPGIFLFFISLALFISWVTGGKMLNDGIWLLRKEMTPEKLWHRLEAESERRSAERA